MNDQITSFRHMILDSYACQWSEAICQIARTSSYVHMMMSVGHWTLRLRKEFLNTPLLLTSVVHSTSNRKDIYSPLDKALGPRCSRTGQLLQVFSNSTAQHTTSTRSAKRRVPSSSLFSPTGDSDWSTGSQLAKAKLCNYSEKIELVKVIIRCQSTKYFKLN
jgi:hypothetical protein